MRMRILAVAAVAGLGLSCPAVEKPCSAAADCPTNAYCNAQLHACFQCASPSFLCGEECCVATAVQAGRAHSCASLSNGDVRCWGTNVDNELGVDVPPQGSLIPFSVSTLAKLNPVLLSAGHYHTCVETDAGVTQCWGTNDGSQLADPNAPSSAKPLTIAGLGPEVVALSGGRNHHCALDNDGGIRCWGYNFWGEIGDGQFNDDTVQPKRTVGLPSKAISLSANGAHTCAITDQNKLYCWGENDQGQLGLGTDAGVAVPTQVTGLAEPVRNIAAGYRHTCALADAPGINGLYVWCWGQNTSGEVGLKPDGGTTLVYSPHFVDSAPFDVAELAAGFSFNCTLRSSGGISCWGANESGQLGTGDTIPQYAPTAVPSLASGVKSISLGYQHACVLMTNGGVKCWGDNTYGQLGDGTTVGKLEPVDVKFAPSH